MPATGNNHPPDKGDAVMAPALPFHPTLTHPATGLPLRAIYVSSKTGRVWWPVLGASEPPPPAPPAPPTPPAPPAPPPDPGFPANTPIEQMTGEQREAYWRHQARKHEDRVKALGGLTPEKLAELQEKATKHDALELELGTTAEKAAAKAAEDAKAEVRGELQPQVISAKLEAAAARAGVSEEDLANALTFADTSKLLASDGSVDADKVKAFIATITPAKGTPPPRVGPSTTGQGQRPGGDAKGTAAERAQARLERLGVKEPVKGA